jgi:hypothetical protein
MLRRSLPALMLCSLSLASPGTPAANADQVRSQPVSLQVRAVTAIRAGVAKTPDPCAFRRAAWGLVQDMANYVNDASSSQSLYKIDKGNTYLTLKYSGIAVNYDYDNKAFSNQFAQVMGAVGYAEDQLKSGDTGGFKSGMRDAARAQGKMWPILNSICPKNGPSHTWLGYLSQFGEGIQTLGVTVQSKHWTLDWWFDCGDSAGNFIVNVDRPGRYLKGVNELSTGSVGLEFYSGQGYYAIKVISECAWEVKVAPD